MANTFFLVYKGDRATVWCDRRGTDSKGRTKFWVINGDWPGVYDPATGEVWVDEDQTSPQAVTSEAKIMWEGQVPPHIMEYNEAFEWLTKTHGIDTKP